MLKTIGVKLLARDLVAIDEGNTIDEVGEAKPKNMIIPNSLAKSKLLIEPSSSPGFLTLGARLIFIKLK